ncbi:plant basic secretory protein [Dendrothele bispora CBS 962.96]|uniref:Plant basic secretory protein n=1 Tax=Dendrothele bispora (strain CBS 962.96) TaxID=1314807 RepID=A0A4S8MFN7_DENBC|nr:plant basic secretory protein [Dendrothele bispora CBS 962.96]
MRLPPPPQPPPRVPDPKLHLRIEDLDHPGVDLFYRLVGGNLSSILKQGIGECTRGLYNTSPSLPGAGIVPRISQITLTLRSFPGVAHTFGTPSNPFEFKEIHFSLNHILNTHNNFKGSIEDKDKRTLEEIKGVLTHELVHCYQWNAKGSCPGGLIEGIADFIRLKASLAPPHWNPSHRPSQGKGDKWDAGYEKTAFFLDWIDQRQRQRQGQVQRPISSLSRYSASASASTSIIRSSSPKPSLLPGGTFNNDDKGCVSPVRPELTSHLRPGSYNPVYIVPLPVPDPVQLPMSLNRAPVRADTPMDNTDTTTIVQHLNALMRDRKYNEDKIWVEVTGKRVNEWWDEYTR